MSNWISNAAYFYSCVIKNRQKCLDEKVFETSTRNCTWKVSTWKVQKYKKKVQSSSLYKVQEVVHENYIGLLYCTTCFYAGLFEYIGKRSPSISVYIISFVKL